jgi:tetratricopeptide (TPR) repeat protein
LGRRSRVKREQRGRAAEPAADSGEPPVRPRSRRAALWTIMLALPFVLLGGAECGLRVAGFGHHREPLFIHSPQQARYLQANPRAVTRFFTDPARAPNVSIETAFFAATKPTGSFRVFVQGESSAAGFPYGLSAALAGVLDRRLEQAFPDREIEVISTAMAAVNSYTLEDFADEIIAMQPDAVVVYAGHNEFLGFLGVGSAMRFAASPSLTRAFLAVRDWRLFQLMSRAYASWRPAPAAPTLSADESLMARVAGERSITLNSGLFQQGMRQFEDNLARLLAKYRAAGIPVLIGTLVSNERDQAPLAVLAGVQTEAAGASKMAYFAAQDDEQAGKYDSARKGYAWSRDLDPLRFRAPAVFNDVIRRVAQAHGAEVVEVHAAFEAASEHGLIGGRLLLEHVHPNLDGYFLLADAFYDAMIARGLPGNPAVDLGEAEARAWMPVSDIDRFLGEYKLQRIVAGWPFKPSFTAPQLPAPATEAERLAQEMYHERISWPEAHDRLRNHYRATGDTHGYAQVTSILADGFPYGALVQFEAAAALIELGRPREAVRYSRRAVELEPRVVNHWLVHAHGLLLAGREDEGRAALGRVLELEPANPTARQVLQELEGH